MLRSFKRQRLTRILAGPARSGGGDPRAVWRIVFSVLLILNLAALGLVIFPPGGSVSQLDEELLSLRSRMHRHQEAVRALRGLVKQVESARAEQESFMDTYFMDLTTASSTIQTEILHMANTSGLKAREHSFGFDPIEGSDRLTMMTITANYEGTYANLMEFVNLVDRSERFLIIDNITSAPQQTQGLLNARFKMNAFLREAPPAEQRPAVAAVMEPSR